MALQIADPAVVAKVERLARMTGLTKTALVERAIDRRAVDLQEGADSGRMAASLAQLDRVPDGAGAFDPLEWDAPRAAEMIIPSAMPAAASSR